jgi:hypothetical protein
MDKPAELSHEVRLCDKDKLIKFAVVLTITPLYE